MSLLRSGHALMRLAKRGYTSMFSRYLLATNTVIAVALSIGGDVLQQRYEILAGRMTHVDRRRVTHIGITGITTGPVCHYWYLYLDKVIQGQTLKVVMKKVLLDQIVATPLLIILFFVTLGVLQKSTTRKIWHETTHKGAEIFIVDCVLWPPIQAVNFLFLPTHLRVLFVNVAALFIHSYYSYVTFRDHKK